MRQLLPVAADPVDPAAVYADLPVAPDPVGMTGFALHTVCAEGEYLFLRLRRSA